MSKYIEWIGTGSGLNPDLGNTSFIVKGEGNRTLLVDCGCTVPPELLKSSQLKDITDVVITHLHSDHIGGLECLGATHYFLYKNRDDKRLNLHVATDKLADRLWNHSLKGGLEQIQGDDGNPINANLETFFKIKIGKIIRIDRLPELKLFETPHVKNMENYGMYIGGGIFYSGDTVSLPPSDERIIFQDCQFYDVGPANVHIPYNRLKKELPSETKARTHLIHLSAGCKKVDPKKDGFAGFVKPGDRFSI